MNSPTLTPTRRAAISEALRARERLIPFAQHTFPGYEDQPHLRLIADELEAIERGDNDRLMVFMPPRHGKTELINIRFPAWYLCRHPEKKLICATHREDLSDEAGRQVRNIVNNQQLFQGVRLAEDSKAKGFWHTNRGGQYLAVGVGSGVVGFGGDGLCLDDPHGKAREIMSPTQLEGMWQWYTTELYNRREPHAWIIVVQHRWAEDDLSGRILSQQPNRWRVVRLPALAEKEDPLGRSIGEPLWIGRYDKADLAETRSLVGEREWNAKYQQRPAPEEGAIFKWWHTYKALPQRIVQLLMPIDTAYTDTEGSDYTAWSLWWDDGDRIGIMDAQRVREETPDAEDALRRYYHKIASEFPHIPVRPLVRRKVAIDRVVGQHLRRSHNGTQGIPVTQVELASAKGDDWKTVNARVVVAEFEGERMLIPYGNAPWLSDWLTEHKQFPNAQHDDWVEGTLIVGRHRFRREPFRRFSVPSITGQV